MKRRGRSGADGWLVGLAGFFLYGLTAAPGIVALFDDSLEFQLVAPTFAIAHPTGYPLYTLLGGLWSQVIFPFGNWAWRMNLFSALAGGATIALLYLLAKRLSGWFGWGFGFRAQPGLVEPDNCGRSLCPAQFFCGSTPLCRPLSGQAALQPTGDAALRAGWAFPHPSPHGCAAPARFGPLSALDSAQPAPP